MNAALALLLVLAAPAFAGAAGPSFGAGTTGTAGSGGYRKLALYADAFWRAESVDPYAWTELSADTYVRELSLGGGVWKRWRDDCWVKGGAGLVLGRLKDSDRSTRAFLLETAIEKDFERPTLGAEYRLTAGSIVDSTALRNSGTSTRARAAAASENYTYNELSGYVLLPAGKTTLALRLTLGLPSYARSVLSQTLSWKIPVAEAWSLTPAFTLEEGRDTYAYFSLNLYYRFGLSGRSRIEGPN